MRHQTVGVCAQLPGNAATRLFATTRASGKDTRPGPARDTGSGLGGAARSPGGQASDVPVIGCPEGAQAHAAAPLFDNSNRPPRGSPGAVWPGAGGRPGRAGTRNPGFSRNEPNCNPDTCCASHYNRNLQIRNLPTKSPITPHQTRLRLQDTSRNMRCF